MVDLLKEDVTAVNSKVVKPLDVIVGESISMVKIKESNDNIARYGSAPAKTVGQIIRRRTTSNRCGHPLTLIVELALSEIYLHNFFSDNTKILSLLQEKLE